MSITFLLFSILLLFPSSLLASTTLTNFQNQCVKCILAGNNYCMIVPATNPGKCCQSMSSSTNYCDSIYKWCTYGFVTNTKYTMCPVTPTCDDVVSVSDNQWYRKNYTLQDGEVCIQRIKYDTAHLGRDIDTLYAEAGDTVMRYADLS